VAPFEERLHANSIDPVALFGGKRVLDAGCGGGRGALLALRSGARHVEAVDVSETNVETTVRVLGQDFDNFAVRLGTLAALPYEDHAFDVVWCNGVLMHTAEPGLTLPEIIRVLEPSGSAWIYVYGRSGVYWRTIAMFRRVFAGASSSDLIGRLAELNLPNGRIAEMIDDWKAPFLRTYAARDWESAFSELGCDYTRLMRGTDYDTCEQLARGGPSALLGEGDLRFLVTKRAATPGELSPQTQRSLDASHLDEMDFAHLDDDAMEGPLRDALAAFETQWWSDPLGGVAQACDAQLFLRDVFLRAPNTASLGRLVELIGGI
jgi:SAM-dependent methyltransferase